MARLHRLGMVTAVVLLGLLALGSPQKFRDRFQPANDSGRVHTALAIVDHGSVYLDTVWDDVYPGWRSEGVLPNVDASFVNGHYLLDKPPGVTLLAVPVVFVLRETGLVQNFSTVLWIHSLLISTLPSILFLLVFRNWLRRSFADNRLVGLVAPAIVVATPWLLFGAQLAAHATAASLVGIGAFLALGRLDALEPGGGDRRGPFLGGLALGGAVLVEASSALLVVGAMIALLVDARRRRRLPWLVLGGLGPAAILLAWNAVAFGDPFTYGYAHKATPEMATAHGRGILGLAAPDPAGLFGLLLSAKRGLFFLSPWLLLAPLGAVWACRDRRIALAWRVLVLVGVAFVPVLLSGFSDWHGGQTIGPRYLIFSLPLFGVGAALAVDRLARSRLHRPVMAVGAGLLLSSLVILLIAQIGMPAVAPDVENPVAEVLLPVLLAAGPIGTILDPLLGATVSTALLVTSVFALLWVGGAATGRLFERRIETPAPRAQRTAIFIIAAAMIAHFVVVAVPRTQGPDARGHVLAAKAYAFMYLGDEDALRAVNEEWERHRRSKLRPWTPNR